MTINELENFYKAHPDGPSYKSIFARCPIKQQLKVVEALKARLDRSADLDRRGRFEFERFKFHNSEIALSKSR